MLDAYRTILTRRGTLLFSTTGLVARLPISMVGLGIVLLVSTVTGSYGAAGAVSAVFLIANALVSVLQGRLLDRLGQAPVLSVAGLVFTGALSVLTASAWLEWPTLVTYAAATVAGASLPAVGACVRARWSHVLDQPAQVQTAYALESVIDEAVFMLGPVLVTVLATSWHPVAGLAAAATAGLVGTLALAAQRSTQPVAGVHQPDTGTTRPPMPWAKVLVIALVCVALGALFGGAEVATVAFTEEHGVKRWSGFLLALWSSGSLIAGIVTGAVRWRQGAGARLRLGAVGLALAMAPLTFIDSIAVLALVLFLGGFAIAPTLIATNSLVAETVPAARLVEGMSIVHTGIAAGVAPGAAITGLLVDAHGASTSYLVAAGAGLLAAVLAQAAPR